jgi:hypothetical protein
MRAAATSHTDFADLSLLGSASAVEAAAHSQFLGVVGLYSRAFFDQYLIGDPVLSAEPSSRVVLGVKRFAPATPPCAPRLRPQLSAATPDVRSHTPGSPSPVTE